MKKPLLARSAYATEAAGSMRLAANLLLEGKFNEAAAAAGAAGQCLEWLLKEKKALIGRRKP